MKCNAIHASKAPIATRSRKARTTRAAASNERAAAAAPSRRDALNGLVLLAGTAALPAEAICIYKGCPQAPPRIFGDPNQYEVADELAKDYELPPVYVSEDARNFAQGKFVQEVQRALKASGHLEGVPWKDAVRAEVMDSGTFQKSVTGSGANGSLHFPEELSRPENKGLAEVIAAYGKAKAEVDKQLTDGATLSWADTIALSGRIVAAEQFKRDYLGCTDRYKKTATFKAGRTFDEIGCDAEFIKTDAEFNGKFATMFSDVDPTIIALDNKVPAPIGRPDGSAAAPDGLIPKPGSSTQEWLDWARDLRLTAPEICALCPFMSPDGSAEAALRDPSSGLSGVFDSFDKGDGFQGNSEGRITRGYQTLVRNCLFDNSMYWVPRFEPGRGWLPYAVIEVKGGMFREKADTKGAKALMAAKKAEREAKGGLFGF